MYFGLEIFVNCTLNLNGSCDHLTDGHWAFTGLFPLRAGCLVPVLWREGKRFVDYQLSDQNLFVPTTHYCTCTSLPPRLRCVML